MLSLANYGKENNDAILCLYLHGCWLNYLARTIQHWITFSLSKTYWSLCHRLSGIFVQVIGPVVDVYFDGTDAELVLPSIHEALEIKRPNGKKLIVEVQQHIGENTVRTVAMDSTDGLQRGMKVLSTHMPITMPVGAQIKGRLMNVVGDSIDGMKELDRKGVYAIHREPPKFEDPTTTQEVLYTGIKVIDLLEPYSKRRKDWFVWWCRCRQNGFDHGAD